VRATAFCLRVIAESAASSWKITIAAFREAGQKLTKDQNTNRLWEGLDCVKSNGETRNGNLMPLAKSEEDCWKNIAFTPSHFGRASSSRRTLGLKRDKFIPHTQLAEGTIVVA
jgi:hypothetical protein